MVRSSRPSARSSLAAVLIPGLLMAGSMTVTAEERAGPVVVVTAPDDPSVRASLAFPPGWRLEAETDDTSRRNVNALAIDERCEVGTRRSDFPDLVTDVDDFLVALEPGSGFVLIGRESVELPAGPAERVDFVAEDEGGRWSVYAVWDGGYIHELWCRGDELPQDRWLPVAETFDLDPNPSLTSSPFEPVVARPDAGVAMAFGESWNVRGSSTSQGLLYATSDTAVCALSDYSTIAAEQGWADVEAMHDAYVAAADAREDLTVDEASYLDLPAGRTGFADIGFADGTRGIRYSFGDGGDSLLALFCVGEPTPDDRYLSLARSVTWLVSDAG